MGLFGGIWNNSEPLNFFGVSAFMSVLHGIASLHVGPAYLDGGTGSMLIQAAIAGVLSGAFIVKTRWAQFKALIASKIKRSDHPS